MGASTANISRNMYNEAERYIMNLVQQGVPWVDADDNSQSQGFVNQIQRLIQNTFGNGAPEGNDGFKIEGDGSSNDFTVKGGDGTNEGSGRFWCGGYPAMLLSDVDFLGAIDSLAGKGADEITHVSTGLTETVLTDSAANFTLDADGSTNANNLAGRILVPDISQPAKTYTIVSNTKTTITISGTMLTDGIQAGSNYQIKMSTPSGSDRSDYVFLDVYLDEIGADEDPNLYHTLGSNIEAQVRLKLIQNIIVDQGQLATTDFRGSGTDWKENGGTWVDADGRRHYTQLLAEIERYNAQDAINAVDVVDKGNREWGQTGAGGGTDFVAKYVSNDQYRILKTKGRLVRLNNKYYSLAADLYINFDKSVDTTWYICFDTTKAEGAVDATYFTETRLDPTSPTFPQSLVPLGKYIVSGGNVTSSNFTEISTRESNIILGDLIPSYNSSTQYRVQNTDGKKIRLNNKYFKLTNDLLVNFDVSSDGTWYICIDTRKTEGEMDATYFLETQTSPTNANFNPEFVVIGEYVVATGAVTQANFVAYSDREMLPKSGLNDLIPNYKDATYYTVQSSKNKKVNINNKFFYLASNLDVTFDTSSDGQWYIYFDSSQAEGAIGSSHFVESQTVPNSSGLNPYWFVIGEYQVSGSTVVESSFNGYSLRQMISWVYGISNIKKASETKTSAGTYSLSHGFNATPENVTYRYWDDSENKFYNYARTDIENYYSNTIINYTIPGDFTFDSGDYFEVIAEYYHSEGSGFASPKISDETDWYSSTPGTTISHSLTLRPKAITLEFYDVSNNIYWLEDGKQFVNKSSGGIEATQVTFDWTGLSSIAILSANMKMKIHFDLSEVSAGAFAASKTERGTVKVLGDANTVESPDLILDSSDAATFATQINALADNSFVYIKESITLTALQSISKEVRIFAAKGAKLICATSLTTLLKFTAMPWIQRLEIETQEDITNAIEFDANGIADSLEFYQNASGKTLTNTVKVNTGYKINVRGIAIAEAGSITNLDGSDADGNSVILIN